MKVVRLSALRIGGLYTPGSIPGTHLLLKAVSTPGLQCGRKDHVNKKIAMTPSGIKLATFRLVEQFMHFCHVIVVK
jgi:hypothetical protein